MPNLNSTIDLDLKKFWRWWRRELGLWVPEKLKQLISDQQGFIIVRPEDGQLSLSYWYRGQSEPLVILDRNEGGITQYQTLLAEDERLSKANVIVRLTDREVISKELILPALAKENLQQVVAYELDRYTPFKPEQIYFAAKALDEDSEPGQIRVMLILTTREKLDALYADINAIGLVPVLIDYEGAANDLEHGEDAYNLLPEWLRQKTAKLPQLIIAGLFATLCLLLGTAMALPVWLESQAVDVLQEKIDVVEPQAKKVKAMQMEIDELTEQTKLLITEKTARPPVVDMLNTLSKLIKDDTSLTYAQYSEGHLQMQGESPAASGLIGVLEASDVFANARFVSPVTQDKVTGLERFQITVDITKPPVVAPEPDQAEPEEQAEPAAANDEVVEEPKVDPAEPVEAIEPTGGNNDANGQ